MEQADTNIVLHAGSAEATRGNRQRHRRLRVTLFLVGLAVALAGPAVVVVLGFQRYWPQPLTINFPPAAAIPIATEGGVELRPPTGFLLGTVGTFSDELAAYLNFEYLRSLRQVEMQKVFLTATEINDKPVYRIHLLLDGDYLTATPYLAGLKAQRFISDYDLILTTPAQVDYARTQTELFVAAYGRPVRSKLEAQSPAELEANVSKFILFKARTDRRTREQLQPVPSTEEARQLAADIVAVAKFYSLPLDFFLGVGAMENNYLAVRGDLEHKVWKRRAQLGDIILKRRRHRVLVLNYSIGVWQITRETLRYAHKLFLADTRDYSQLPERLRPPKDLNLDQIDSHVLTTYAALLLRDLLDRFNGDVSKAIGAYNGGPHNPNLDYAEGVSTVADYARNVLQQAALMNGQAIARTRLVIRRSSR